MFQISRGDFALLVVHRHDVWRTLSGPADGTSQISNEFEVTIKAKKAEELPPFWQLEVI